VLVALTSIHAPAAEILLFSSNVTLSNSQVHGFQTLFAEFESIYAKPAAIVCLPPSDVDPGHQKQASHSGTHDSTLPVIKRGIVGTITFKNMMFAHNHAEFGIGALRIDGYRVSLHNSVFFENSGFWGAASFYLSNKLNLTDPLPDIMIDHTVFLNNTGAIVSPLNIYRAKHVRIEKSIFRGNHARYTHNLSLSLIQSRSH
jgi:hypothetical protein